MHCPFPTTTFFVVVATAQFWTVPAHADSCDNDCSTVTSKLLNCGSDVDFLNFLKLDAAIDNCLCANETINAFRKFCSKSLALIQSQSLYADHHPHSHHDWRKNNAQ